MSCRSELGNRRVLTSRMSLALVVALVTNLAGCVGSKGLGTADIHTLNATALRLGGPFPKGFLWGVGTAGYQCEGGEVPNNWQAWERNGKLKQRRGNAVDFWNRFEEDLDLAKDMGLRAFRMSIEWSRIEPRMGEFDEEAIAHYRKILSAARDRGLEPVVTLQHFVYPAWLDAGPAPLGFERLDTARHFARYARRMAREFRGMVNVWLTINEPNVLSLGSYAGGFFPPGRLGLGSYTRAVSGIVAAHRAAYQAIHEESPESQVSSNVFYLYAGKPTNYDPGTIWGNAEVLGFWGQGTSAELQSSRLPEQLNGPYIQDLGLRYLDFLAIDYYWGMATRSMLTTRKPYGWSVSPYGLQAACKDLWDLYHKPILIAENGMATENLSPRKDGWTREAFIVHHLYYLRQAIAAGVPVLGYIHWALTDNFEWGDWTARFGLFAVDALKDPQLKRVPTAAVDVYREIATSNSLPSRLVWQHIGIGSP